MDQLNDPQVDPPSPPVSWWLKQSMRWRFVLLGCYLVLSAAWYWVFCSSVDPLGVQFWKTSDRSVIFLIGTLFLFGVQLLFLLGAPHLRWPRSRRRRSMFVSLAAGSAIAALLSLGIFFAVLELNSLLFNPASFQTSWMLTTAPTTTTTAAPATAGSNSGSDIPWSEIGIAAVAWTFWFLIFALVGAVEWMGRYRQMYRILIAGTILELLITIPVDAEVRRRTNCYCLAGTLISLAIGLTAILWTFGPGVAILFLIRHKQIRGASGKCLGCGYDLRGLNSSCCPECGRAFKGTAIPA